MKNRADADDAGREAPERRPRADAQRNIETLISAAKAVFAASGVDAPVREIADAAGVGIGTLYRHFPTRADLVAAVFRAEIDACADAASEIAARLPPGDALAEWMRRFAAFIAVKRGLASMLHSGDPAFTPLPSHFDARLVPALQSLITAAAAAGEVRGDIPPEDLIHAIAGLCMAADRAPPGHIDRMVALVVDGLRYGAR